MAFAERIAFVCPRFAGDGTVGGAETLLQNLAVCAASAGRKVTFLTTCAQNHFTWENTLSPGRKTYENLEVEFFPVDQDRDIEAFLGIQEAISNGGSVSTDDERKWISNSVNSLALYEHLRKHGELYDRIVIGPYLFGLTWHASEIHPDKTLLVPCLHDEPFAYLGIMQEMFDRVRGFIFNTEPEFKLARSIFNIKETMGNIVGIGLNGFDPDPEAFAKKHLIQQPYVMYSGRREPLKGTPLLLDYMHAFRDRTGLDIRILFTGSGQIEAPPDLEPYIIDLGFVSEDEKREAMAGALAFVHPSVNESLGIVVLEAWLARTPALVREKCEVLKWQCLRSGGGLWFRNYPEFEEELGLLFENKDLRLSLGESGRAYVEREYSWKSVESRLLSALDETEQVPLC